MWYWGTGRQKNGATDSAFSDGAPDFGDLTDTAGARARWLAWGGGNATELEEIGLAAAAKARCE